LVLGVASSARVYLLVMVNITPLLEEHDDRLIVDLRDDIPLIAEVLNELPE
jgi:hypothetical protein